MTPSVETYALAARFTSYWGHRFSGRFKSAEMYDAAMIEFEKDLAPFDEEIIDKTFELCKREFVRDNCPTLPMFLERCRCVQKQSSPVGGGGANLKPIDPHKFVAGRNAFRQRAKELFPHKLSHFEEDDETTPDWVKKRATGGAA